MIIMPSKQELIMPVNHGIIASSKAPVVDDGGGDTGLQADVPSTCFVLSASDAASYDGSSQTWSNIVETPADGSAQTDFDFYLGDTGSASSDDPAYIGTAPKNFSFDGGDWFNGVANAPSLFQTLQRTDTNGWWFAFVLSRPSATTRPFSCMTDPGLQITTTNTVIQLTRFNVNGVSTSTNLFGTYATGDVLMLISLNLDKTEASVWYNSRTAAVSSISWPTDTSLNNNGTGSPARMGRNRTGTYAASGHLVYGVAGGNSYLTNTEAGKIFDYFNAQTGITFA